MALACGNGVLGAAPEDGGLGVGAPGGHDGKAQIRIGVPADREVRDGRDRGLQETLDIGIVRRLDRLWGNRGDGGLRGDGGPDG